MPRVALNEPAPNFTLANSTGKRVSLSDYEGHKNILLVFNRGFG